MRKIEVNARDWITVVILILAGVVIASTISCNQGRTLDRALKMHDAEAMEALGAMMVKEKDCPCCHRPFAETQPATP